MRVVLFLSLLLCTGCGLFEKKDNEPAPTIQPIEQLRAKADKYKTWTADLEDDQGSLVEYFGCDTLLLQSLYVVAADSDMDITIFEGGEGEFFRTPTHDCIVWDEETKKWIDNGSKTSISRDMLIGLFHYIWDRQDLDIAKRLVNFGREADPQWFMGQGVNFLERESRTHLRGPLLGTLFEMVHRMGGEDNPIRKFPFVPNSKGSGFELHLQVLHIHLRGKIFGGVSDTELKILKQIHEKQPANAYYCAVYNYFKDGDQSHAIESLLDETLFPTDRLPTERDRCSDYIFQRDDDRGSSDPKDDDWKPCHDLSRDKVHPGVDFLWAFKTIDTAVRK